MTAVAILIPVLGRPHRIIPIIESVSAATPEPHRVLFLASPDDEATIAALEAAGTDYLVVGEGRRSWAKKINDGYRATTEPWIFTGADDLAFHPDWSARALTWAGEKTAVIGTNDIANPRVMTGQHSTHSLFRRSYVDEYGTADGPGIMHEGYPHEYADDEAVATAMARGVYVHAFDSIVEHLHPNVGKAPDDDTYRLGRVGTREGKRLFLSRRRLWAAGNLDRPAAPTRAVAVTASYGGIDTALHPPVAQDIPVDWICFTDQEDLKVPAPWKAIHTAGFDHPRLAVKTHKATPNVDCPDVVWIDGSMEITSQSFVREALAARHDGVAVFRHPRRDDIYLEADASLGAEGQNGKYAGQPLLAQVAAYRAEGHPEDGGLYACGVVAWDLANPKAVELGRAWLAECERWSWQDQLSFPVVCRRLGVTPGVFPVRQIERSGRGFLGNRWLKIHSHTAGTPATAPTPSVPTAVSVLIPYGGDDEHRQAARRYVLDWYARHHPTWEIIEGTCAGEIWSKGEALADAAARASHDVFVLGDADSILVPDVLDQAAALVADGAPWVIPHRMVFRLDQAPTDRIYAGTEPEANPAWCIKPRGRYVGVAGGGIVVLSRAAWDTVGGIDPRFVRWGAEDLSFALALDTLAGPHVRLDAALVHLWHELEPRGERRVGGPENSALHRRYAKASRNVEAMRDLVAEHSHEVAV